VRAISGCLALSAFSVAIISGLLADKALDSILSGALVALLVGQIVGYALGRMLAAAYREALGDYERRNPIPEMNGASSPELGASVEADAAELVGA